MTDSFFGFEDRLPTLGSGKSREYENEMFDAPEEDEINQLNDETFGNAIEEDWEENHKKLADGIKSYHENGDQSYNDTGYKTHEDELEQSLSQLVVDDDESEPYHSKPIPKARQPANVDNLFGPSSPPGFLNTEELVGGQNIWGSPVRESYMPQQEDGLKNLLKVLQKPKVTQPQHALQDPSILSAVTSMSSSLPNAVTLEEIEHNMVQKNSTPVVIPHPGFLVQNSRVPAKQPRVRTLSEIEQEMTGPTTHPRKIPSPPMQGFPFPIGTPPRGHGFMTPPPPITKVGTMAPIAIPGVGRGVNMSIPPPMPTPGHLSTSAPQSQSVGSPGLNPVAILHRNTPPSIPPPRGPANQPHHAPPPRRSSPVMVNQGGQGGELGDNTRVNVALSGVRSTSPLEGTSFMSPATPQQLRMVHPPPHSDQTHVRGSRGPQNLQGAALSPGVKQALFSGQLSRGRGRDDHNNRFREDFYNRDYNNHDEYNNRRDFHNNRGDFHNNRGDFHNNRGDFHNNRGDFHSNRGDFHHNRGDFHNNRGDFQSRGDFHNNRGDFHSNRGDFHHIRGDFHGNRGDFHSRGRGDFHGRGGYNNRDDYNRGPDGFNPWFRGRGYHGNENYRPRPRYNSYGDDDYEDDVIGGDNKDEFAGLMTRKEKDWVIKIQLMQIQTDNPYLDDYYYTSWAMKQMTKQRQTAKDEDENEQKSEPKLVIPHLARLEAKSYKPVQFENSLGRVTASSVHNPRQIIDIKRTSSIEHEDAKAREVRRFKEMLLDVEKGYDLLLDVDDLEKKALGLPEDNRPPLFERRSQNIHELFALVHARLEEEDGIMLLITIRKGLKLVCRLLPLLPMVEGCMLLGCLLRELTAISKKDWQTEVLPDVYPLIVPVISGASLEMLVCFTRDLTGSSVNQENSTNSIMTALQNKFGTSVIWALISRGEVIYSTQSPVDMDISHQQQWNQFVSLVATAISSLSKDNLAVPQENYPKVMKHVRRVLDKRTFLTVEDKLQLVVSPSVS